MQDQIAPAIVQKQKADCAGPKRERKSLVKAQKETHNSSAAGNQKASRNAENQAQTDVSTL